MSKTKKYSHRWFLLGLLGVLIAAPNATVIKYAVDVVSPLQYNALRFFVVALLTTPPLVTALKRLTRYNLSQSLQAGFFMSIAVVSYVTSIKLSQASYVSIITLVTPIVFILFSTRINGEKINRRAMAGVTLAAIGAMVIVMLPLAIRQSGEFVFYPLATVFALINSVSYALAIIKLKTANEAGVPLPALLSISSWVVALTSAVMFSVAVTQGTEISPLNSRLLLGVFYSGVAVALIARLMTVSSYEHIGSVRTSALAYVETLVAIIVPVIILHEQLSIEMIVGGILILLGVYVAEHHKSAHHKHHHIFRSH